MIKPTKEDGEVAREIVEASFQSRAKTTLMELLIMRFTQALADKEAQVSMELSRKVTKSDREVARDIVGDEIFKIVSDAAHLGLSEPSKRARLSRIATETLIHVISQALASTRKDAYEECAKIVEKGYYPNDIVKSIRSLIEREGGR